MPPASCRCFGAFPERVHSPQFKAGPVVSKGFCGDAGDMYCGGGGTRYPIHFLLRQAGTSADIFYTNPRGSSQAICFTSLADALIQELGQKLRNHA